MQSPNSSLIPIDAENVRRKCLDTMERINKLQARETILYIESHQRKLNGWVETPHFFKKLFSRKEQRKVYSFEEAKADIENDIKCSGRFTHYMYPSCVGANSYEVAKTLLDVVEWSNSETVYISREDWAEIS